MKLKPCPLCGGQAGIATLHGKKHKEVRVFCNDCRNKTGIFGNRRRARKEWNKQDMGNNVKMEVIRCPPIEPEPLIENNDCFALSINYENLTAKIHVNARDRYSLFIRLGDGEWRNSSIEIISNGNIWLFRVLHIYFLNNTESHFTKSFTTKDEAVFYFLEGEGKYKDYRGNFEKEPPMLNISYSSCGIKIPVFLKRDSFIVSVPFYNPRSKRIRCVDKFDISLAMLTYYDTFNPDNQNYIVKLMARGEVYFQHFYPSFDSAMTDFFGLINDHSYYANFVIKWINNKNRHNMQIDKTNIMEFDEWLKLKDNNN